MEKLNVGIADDNELMVHLLSDIVTPHIMAKKRMK